MAIYDQNLTIVLIYDTIISGSILYPFHDLVNGMDFTVAAEQTT